ncbi:MAG: PLP-dependent aminotransferase family protein [bacterium]
MNSKQPRFAVRTGGMESSIIREILKLTQKGEVISFAGGVPEPGYFPVDILKEIGERVLTRSPVSSLQYAITEGFPPLREYLSQSLKTRGVKVSPEEILITSGSQQGIDLMGKIFLDPGDFVLTERPTFLGMIQACRVYEARFVSQPIDDEGIMLDGLTDLIKRHNPKLLYLLPNFQNPSGVTLSRERREAVALISQETGTPILEDDPYNELIYEGEALPPVKTWETASVLMGTFSKIVAPGHRVAWITAPREIIKLLVQAKQASDLHSNTFSQQVMYEYCAQGYLEPHIRMLRERYKIKRNAMLAAMDRYFPAQVSWTRPGGGLFIWVTLPEGKPSAQILKEAVKQGVAFVPGKAFYAGSQADNALRLSFATATEEQIEEGISKLGEVLSHTFPT